MKKNFLKVAALLIAAMLMVVSCTQEVAPKNENEGLVRAILSVDFGKDVVVSSLDNTVITYEYTFKPKWDTLSNGTKPYGAVTTATKLTATSAVTGNTVAEEIGYVTPGLWEVNVIGYANYTDSAKKAKVLEGSRTVYINNTNTGNNGKVNVSVLVSPVSEGVGSVSFTLYMQDLNDNNKINYSIVNVDGTTTRSGSITPNEDGYIGGKAAYKYELTLNGVKAGFNTVSITVNDYDGGITKTFLLLANETITVSGSVYPSAFKAADLSIFLVDVSKGTMSIVKTTDDAPVNVADSLYTLTPSTSYTFQYNDGDNMYVENVSAYGLTGEFTKAYEWYVNGVKVENETQASYSKDFGTVYGDYSVTCKLIYKYTEGGVVKKTWIGNASIGNIRVPAPASASN